MAYRSAIHRVLARSQTTARKSISPSVPSTGHSVSSFVRGPGVHCVISKDRDSPGGSEWKEGDDDYFATHFAARFSAVSKDMSSHDSDEGSKGSPAFSGMVPAYWNKARTDNSVAMPVIKQDRKQGLCDSRRQSVVISPAQIAQSRTFGRFSGDCLGRYASTSGTLSLSPGVWSRSFNSLPAAAEGTQIAVDGEQLNALQAGLTGVSDAASAVDHLPSSGALSEVATAAADCSYPTAFIQYVIDGVHLGTGLPWWASIAATTVAIRILVFPIMVYQMKSTARLTLMRPELEKLTNHIKESGYDPKVVEDNQIRMKALFIKHKTSPFSPVLGAFVQAPIFMCFFFAIRNMAEKMESFKQGGMLWFTDLSTPDSLFIMPVLSGAFFLLTIELGATDGMQGQPMLGKMKMVLRGLAVLLVPLTASFPKALFCYWLTANVCSIIQAAVLKQPGVKTVLGIPDVSHLAKPADIPVMPTITFSQPPRLKGDTRGASSKRQGS